MRVIVAIVVWAACDAGPRPEQPAPAPTPAPAPAPEPPTPAPAPLPAPVVEDDMFALRVMGTAPSMPKRCSLEGRIVDRATGAPLPHAVVGADSVIAEESEKDGRFDLEYVTLPTTFVVQYGWYFERQFPFVAGWCDHELRIEIDKARAIRKPD